MKKFIFAAVLLLSVTTSYAQLNFGVKAGYNSSLTLQNISSVTNGSYDLNSVQSEMWNNFHAGLFARVFFTKKVYLEPELLYSVQKKQYQLTLQDALNPSGISLNRFVSVGTVDVPLLVGIKLLDFKLVNLRAFAGPKLRFLSTSDISFKDPTTGAAYTPGGLVDNLKKANVGLEVGAGVDVLMFTLDARYNFIGNMYDTKVLNSTIANLPSSTLLISVGYKFF
jgi:hypothetical protein